MGNLLNTYIDKFSCKENNGEQTFSDKTVRAICKYSSRQDGDLEFEKDEILEVFQDNGDWWYAKSSLTKKEGYIPSNFVQKLEKKLLSNPWFHGNMTRYEATRNLLLPDIEDGTFLVRKSNNEYALSVRHSNEVEQFKIYKEKKGFYIRKKHFTTLSALIKHYRTHREGMKVALIKPLELNEEPEIRGLSFKRNEEWDIPSDELVFERQLGSGCFGAVYQGKWNGKTDVAIKTFLPETTDEDFHKEVAILKHFMHPRLLQLYGVSTRGNDVCIVTELMTNGSLLDYLKLVKCQGKELHPIVLIDIGVQIADGMSHLEFKNFVHRDLAARNILVGKNVKIKIGDFGLARIIKEEIYEASEGTRLPVKWTAPEGYLERRFSTKSDVWSFGILLTEIVTYGEMPYPGKSNDYVTNQVFRGARMEKPENCSDELYQIMMSCWNKKEQDRPGFVDLERELKLLTLKM